MACQLPFDVVLLQTTSILQDHAISKCIICIMACPVAKFLVCCHLRRKVLQQRNKLRVDVVRYAEKVIHLHAYIDQLEAGVYLL